MIRSAHAPCNLGKAAKHNAPQLRQRHAVSASGVLQKPQPHRLNLHAQKSRSRHVVRSGLETEEAEAARTAAYNQRMAEQMGWENAGKCMPCGDS